MKDNIVKLVLERDKGKALLAFAAVLFPELGAALKEPANLLLPDIFSAACKDYESRKLEPRILKYNSVGVVLEFNNGESDDWNI